MSTTNPFEARARQVRVTRITTALDLGLQSVFSLDLHREPGRALAIVQDLGRTRGWDAIGEASGAPKPSAMTIEAVLNVYRDRVTHPWTREVAS